MDILLMLRNSEYYFVYLLPNIIKRHRRGCQMLKEIPDRKKFEIPFAKSD